MNAEIRSLEQEIYQLRMSIEEFPSAYDLKELVRNSETKDEALSSALKLLRQAHLALVEDTMEFQLIADIDRFIDSQL